MMVAVLSGNQIAFRFSFFSSQPESAGSDSQQASTTSSSTKRAYKGQILDHGIIARLEKKLLNTVIH